MRPKRTDYSELHLVLTRVWWHEAASNRKLIEYRSPTPKWMKQIYERRELIKVVRFARGYTDTTITRTVEKIDLAPRPIPEFRNLGHFIRIHYAAGEAPPFHAGDVVYHTLSSEEWVLAVDQEGEDVYPAGWPLTIAKAADCFLLRRSGVQDRADMLKRCAAIENDPRGTIARRQIAAARVLLLTEKATVAKAGFAGVLPTGEVVDRRRHPTAIPMQENTLLGIPAPKPIEAP